MTNGNRPYDGAGRNDTLRRWANLFEITNGADLTIDYRLVKVEGLPLGDEYDKNLNQLVKAVAYDLQEPVALVRRGDPHHLAIPAEARLPKAEVPLVPHIAKLIPDEETHSLNFGRLDATTTPIATKFLEYALRTPLMRDHKRWGAGRAYYSKRPLNADDPKATVDLYPGFVWSVRAMDGGRLFVAVETTVRYIDRRWISERLNGDNPDVYRARHFLYHFGHQWYMVQLWGLTGRSVAEQRFQPEGQDRVVDVLSYTRERWRHQEPVWVRDLDPKSPAIIYRYPGNQKDRYGALGLCKLALSTQDAEAAGLHRRAMLDPTPRFERIARIVSENFQRASIAGHPIRVSSEPLEIQRRTFAIPAQRFGHDRIMAVAPGSPSSATDIVPLEELGRRRLGLLLDSAAGALDATPFDAQYLLLPQSLPREIGEDFERRFVEAMRAVSGQAYAIKRVVYDDRQSTSLYQQVQAIQAAITENALHRGYALLVLPERGKRDLHNYIKRALWPNLQVQCAMAGKICSHYVRVGSDSGFQPAPDRARRLASYVRNCALGMLVVNRKWPWALAEPLHSDVYIGIDVLNRMAGLTFVYGHGQHVVFKDYPSHQKERLSARQLRQILVERLREDLRAFGIRPTSLVIHRDGRTFGSELRGLHLAVQELVDQGMLPPDLVFGVVDIRKTSTDHLRLVEGESLTAPRNPTIGTWWSLGTREGIICTTGRPFNFPGTAKPLSAVVVEGDLPIEWVLEDILALSQLVFTAPDKCARLPLTIKLTDDFLEPIAGDADEEAALYDEEPEEGGEPAFNSNAPTQAKSAP